MDYTYHDIAKMIDHSLLNPTLTAEELEQGCRLALDYDCASVCIMPYALRRCAEILQGSTVKASTTIGFPHGGHTTATKVAEAQRALDDGGQELDMVVNISKVLSEDWDYVRQDIGAVIEVAHGRGQKVKVIFENCYLQDQPQDQALRNLRRVGRRLGEDFHRVRHRRRHHRRPQADAAALPGARAGESRGRRSHTRQTAGSPRPGRDARGRQPHRRNSGRVQEKAEEG